MVLSELMVNMVLLHYVLEADKALLTSMPAVPSTMDAPAPSMLEKRIRRDVCILNSL